MAEIEISRCSGHCCRSFWFPYSPGEFRRKVLAGSPIMEDGEQILDMLVYLRWTTKMGFQYTCRHLVDGSHCAIYDDRPRMCREYPYGEPCKYPGCTRRTRRVEDPPQELAVECVRRIMENG